MDPLIRTPEGNVLTQRLLLRRWRPEDAESLRDLCREPQVAAWFPAAMTLDAAERLVDAHGAAFDRGEPALLAVELRERPGLLGFCGLSRPTFEAAFMPCIEVGWRLTRTVWGRGLATEAARAVLHDGFTRLALAEVVSFTSADNLRSRAVMERLGMRREAGADFDHPRVPVGHPLRAHVLYRLSVETWAVTERTGRPGHPRV